MKVVLHITTDTDQALFAHTQGERKGFCHKGITQQQEVHSNYYSVVSHHTSDVVYRLK